MILYDMLNIVKKNYTIGVFKINTDIYMHTGKCIYTD